MADDLITAGAQSPEPDVGGLLRALSQSPMQQAMQDPWTRVAGVLQGYGAGIQGQPNPLFQQLQQQEDVQRRSLMAQFSILQSAKQDRQQKTRMQLDVGRDLLKMDSPEARKMGAETLGSILKSQGVQVPPTFVQSLSHGSLSLDKRKQAYISISAGGTDDYLTGQLGIPKEQIPQLRQEAQSDPIHKLLYGKTKQQEAIELQKSDLDQRKYDLTLRKQDLMDAKMDLSLAKDERQAKEAQQRFALMEGHLRVSQSQLDLANRKFDYSQANGPKEKQAKALDQAEGLVNNMEATARALDAKGYLPTPGASALGVMGVKIKRTSFPNDADWQLWKGHLQAGMIGYARSVQNDIGPRAMQAFQGPQQIMENPPDLPSVLKITTKMREAIALGRGGGDTAQFVLLKRPDGMIERVPWKRGMDYKGLAVMGVE